MQITVIGSGYVGLVAGACLSNVGHHVTCADVDGEKVASLTDGHVPFFEPGLSDIVRRNLEAGRLNFTTDVSFIHSVDCADVNLLSSCNFLEIFLPYPQFVIIF